MYIRKCLGVIEKSNYITKDILKGRARPIKQQAIALFYSYFKEAHKKQQLENLQENGLANGVMLQR